MKTFEDQVRSVIESNYQPALQQSAGASTLR